MNNKTGFWKLARYKFDNTMSGGSFALIGWLSLISLILIVVSSIFLTIFSISPEDKPVGFIESVWLSLMHTLDSGAVGGDNGWAYRVTMLLVTIGGIFIVSIL